LHHLIDDLKNLNPNSPKDVLMQDELKKAVEKLPAVFEAYASLETADKKSRYFKQAYEAIWATLSVHSHEIMDARSKTVDYRRYFQILRTISEFDAGRPKFSFYKVRRAIEGRFSLAEFVRCKI
jgi:hypothetical protein